MLLVCFILEARLTTLHHALEAGADAKGVQRVLDATRNASVLQSLANDIDRRHDLFGSAQSKQVLKRARRVLIAPREARTMLERTSPTLSNEQAVREPSLAVMALSSMADAMGTDRAFFGRARVRAASETRSHLGICDGRTSVLRRAC